MLYKLLLMLLFPQIIFNVAPGGMMVQPGDEGGDDDGGDDGGGDDGGGDDGGGKGGGDFKWQDNWRDGIAASFPEGDERTKELKRLERFKTPHEVYKFARESEKIAMQLKQQGLARTKPPEGATDEDMVRWRKDNGIPAKPEGYVSALDEGLVIGDIDKEAVAAYFEYAHDNNMTPAEVNQNIDWYFKFQAEQAQDRVVRDVEDRQLNEDILRRSDQWGDNFTTNINRVQSLLDLAPVEVQNKLLSARVADGSPFGNDPDVLKYLLYLADQINPVGPVVKGGSADNLKSVNNRIDEIQKYMRTNRNEYNKDSKMQDELLQLYDTKNKMDKRQQR